MVDVRGFNVTPDIQDIGIGGIISSRIKNRLQKKALEGDSSARVQLASRDPRMAGAVGGILRDERQTEEMQRQRAQEAEAKKNEVMSRIARTVSSTNPENTVQALQSIIPLIAQDPDLADMIPEIQDDIDRFPSDPQSVIDEYKNANLFYSDPQAFQESAAQRERADLLRDFEGATDDSGAIRPIEELTPTQRSAGVKLGIIGRQGLTAEEFGDREREKVLGKESTETGKLDLEKKKLTIDQAKRKLDDGLRNVTKQMKGKDIDNQAAISNINKLLEGGYRAIYGKVDSKIPDILRSQKALDAIALRDQVVGLLSLENRQKLKGQGTITDSEAATLERAATVLSNVSISDTLAKSELERVREIFSDDQEVPAQTITAPPQPGAESQPPQQGVRFLGFE